MGSISGWGTKIPQAFVAWQKNKQTNKKKQTMIEMEEHGRKCDNDETLMEEKSS